MGQHHPGQVRNTNSVSERPRLAVTQPDRRCEHPLNVVACRLSATIRGAQRCGGLAGRRGRATRVRGGCGPDRQVDVAGEAGQRPGRATRMACRFETDPAVRVGGETRQRARSATWMGCDPDRGRFLRIERPRRIDGK